MASVAPLSTLTPADHGAWRELLGSCPASAPFVEEAWITAWRDAFGPREPLVVRHREADGTLVGLGVMEQREESWGGRTVRVIQSLTSVETPRFEMLASCARVDVLGHLVRALAAGQWDVIRLEHLPEDSPTLEAGLAMADALGWTPVVETTLESPWRALPSSPEAWEQGLKPKFRSNLRNRERRLAALGRVDFSVVGAGPQQGGALDVFYALEASGWKGESGTAIARRADTKAFYDALHARTADHLWVPILSVGGRPVAAQLIRVHDRSALLLKTAYDPEFSAYAPGQLVTARAMRHAIEAGMEVFDFLGDDMPWKQDWAPRLRRHHRLSLFAPTARGRYAYWTRYGVREHARRIPGAVRSVRWLRAHWRHA
jgi:CelD/BcsL family acetyltransferase involved in cellulose biosynthesis